MPFQITNRTNTANRVHAQRGFTIIELMIALAVVGVIASLALPSYQTLLEKRQVTSGAEQLAAFLSSARLEAVKRNQVMAVDLDRTGSDSWCVGMAASTDDCDCTVQNSADGDACVVDGALRVFTASQMNYPDIMNAVSGTTTFYFEPTRGLVYQGADEPFDGAVLELVSQGGSGQYGLNVGITMSGRVKICSDASKPVPGFAECAEVADEEI